MIKTFYSLEITLYEVTADVDHNNVSIDGGKRRKKEEIMSVWKGSIADTLAGAIVEYRKADEASK